MNYKNHNRNEKKKPKSGKFWCSGCDRDLVSEWKKCKTCGQRNGSNRFKKE